MSAYTANILIAVGMGFGAVSVALFTFIAWERKK